MIAALAFVVIAVIAGKVMGTGDTPGYVKYGGIIVGPILLWVGITGIRRHQRLVEEGVVTTGMITGFKHQAGEGISYYHPVIEFEDGQGVSHSMVGRDRYTQRSRPEKGTQVSVVYSRSNPDLVEVVGSPFFVVRWGAVVGGGVWFIISIVSLYKRLRMGR